MTAKQQYNYEYLQNICQGNNIILLKDYSNEKITRDIKIEGKCKTDKCDETFCKIFRQLTISGGFCKVCTELNRQRKVNLTNLINYGCKNVFQSEEIKNKIKETNLERYGDTCALRNPLIKDKIKKSNVKNYGVEYTFQSEEVKNKIKETNLERYGDPCALRNPLIKEKQQNTNIERYGGISPLCSSHVKDKCKITSLINYGVEYPMQNAEYSELVSKNSYKSKDYIFPSGKIIKIQGYENYVLDEVLQKENILEDDIITSKSQVPEIWYLDSSGKKHRYYVDIFILSQNRMIECKSTWTMKKGIEKNNIYLKQQACKDSGYSCEIWVYNSKGKKVECIL